MLSVVLTSYNYARFLPAALAALAAQIRQPDELIVIDDNSSDGSVAVITSFLSRFTDARLLQNKSNLGTIANLNRGLELARGEVVFFAAADDIAYPELTGARGWGCCDAHPQAALFSGRSDIIDVRGEREGMLPTATPLPKPGFIDAAAVVSPADAGRQLADREHPHSCAAIAAPRSFAAGGGSRLNSGSFCDGYVSRLLALRHRRLLLARGAERVAPACRRLCLVADRGLDAWTQELVAAVQRRIEIDEAPFPSGYASRWARRYLFGARRFALTRQTRTRPGRGGDWRSAGREPAKSRRASRCSPPIDAAGPRRGGAPAVLRPASFPIGCVTEAQLLCRVSRFPKLERRRRKEHGEQWRTSIS